MADELNSNLAKYKLDLRIGEPFFGQIKRESPSLSGAAESLNYTPEGLIGTFGYHKSTGTKPEKTDGLRKRFPMARSRLFGMPIRRVIANQDYISALMGMPV